jgi:hypothetical protein
MAQLLPIRKHTAEDLTVFLDQRRNTYDGQLHLESSFGPDFS